ncbi:MAG: Zn-ribbon domain-containing OB-fold protein [Acidimicrobiia bacterium]
MSYGAIELSDLGGRETLPPPYYLSTTAPYWQAAAEGRYVIPRCSNCGEHRWPVVPVCHKCLSTDWAWDQVSGLGEVYSFFWVDAPMHPSMADKVPYDVAVILLEGTQGEPVRVPGWVTGVDKTSLRCGLKVEVYFEPFLDDVGIPVWRPRS